MKKVPLRRCVGCREMHPKPTLIRVVKKEGSPPAVDTSQKGEGRGAYLCPKEDCIQKGEKTKGLQRSLKGAIPANLYQEIERAKWK